MVPMRPATHRHDEPIADVRRLGDAERVTQLHGVFAPESAEVMARAAGFRNLLLHRYPISDDAAVVNFLAYLDQVEQYVNSALGWLAT